MAPSDGETATISQQACLTSTGTGEGCLGGVYRHQDPFLRTFRSSFRSCVGIAFLTPRPIPCGRHFPSQRPKLKLPFAVSFERCLTQPVGFCRSDGLAVEERSPWPSPDGGDCFGLCLGLIWFGGMQGGYQGWGRIPGGIPFSGVQNSVSVVVSNKSKRSRDQSSVIGSFHFHI